MHIQFYGHSICNSQRHANTKTFADILLEKYNAQRSFDGISTISEERILYNIKKTKNIDVAIIFHSEPKFYFAPGFSRDFDKSPIDELKEKLDVNNAPLFYKDALRDKNLNDCISEKLDSNDLVEIFNNFQSYFITPELLNQRFHGSLLQIDSFLKFKNIPTIHCPYGPWTIPSWFKFTHGIVDNEISRIQFYHLTDDTQNIMRNEKNNEMLLNPYHCSYNKSDNAITEEGNILIAEKLSKYIDSLIQK